MAYQLTTDDLIAHLREQVEFLRWSASAFDEGKLGEAKRLAMPLRVLLHHTPKSQSVLEQLGQQQALAFVDTSPPPVPDNLLSSMGFLVMAMGSGGNRYVAPLGDLPPPFLGRTKPFDAWWHDTVIVDANGEDFSRKSFVLGLANTEGGGHVDPTLNEKYARLTKHDGLGWMYRDETGVPQSLGSPAPFAVRQITYEVLETLSHLPYIT